MYVFQIIVGYRPTKKYTLTPSRKKIGKAVAHGSKKALAKQCMEDPVTKRHLFDLVGLSLRREMKVMVSDSTNSLLKSQEVERMKSFSWASVLDELTNNTPTLLFFLHECTNTKKNHPNTLAIIGACAAILLKHRLNRMSVFQKMVSIVLYAGHTSKQVT